MVGLLPRGDDDACVVVGTDLAGYRRVLRGRRQTRERHSRGACGLPGADVLVDGGP
jgi:hypothetical protein